MNISGAIAVIMGALLAASCIVAWPWMRRRWRAPAMLSMAQRNRLASWLPWHAMLDHDQRDKLARLSARLLADVRFVGCNGLVVTRDMQLIIAGQASLLCLGAQPAGFALPSEILVYPEPFYIPRDMPDGQGLVDDLPMLASGEAWPQGRVILSWRDIRAALAGAEHNVVLHEFAHLLDFAAPAAEGAPPMADYDSWSASFGNTFEQLRDSGSPIIDIYGTQSPAEFFAVAVEAFFQRGTALAQAHPDIHTLMTGYFNIDTATREPRFQRA